MSLEMSFVKVRLPSGHEQSTAISSEDGRGETQPIPEMKAGARYIYYRLYTRDGPLESYKPIYSNDRSISRISSRSVRPPQTAALLKRYLCKIEGLKAFESCTLYQSLSDKTALEDSTFLSFQGTPGPGLSDLDPMALVFDTSATDKRSQASSTIDPSKLLERDYEISYAYYLVYDEDGEAVSKTTFSESNPSLGRVKTLSIPPPHTVSSLKFHLIKSEEISGHNVELFEKESSKSTMDEGDAIALLADTFPGFVEDQPMALVYEPHRPETTGPANNEDPNETMARDLQEAHSALARIKEELEKSKETHGRELTEARSEIALLKEELKTSNKAHGCLDGEEKRSPALIKALLERPSFRNKLKATRDERPTDPKWHTIKLGDIFYTDGIPRREDYGGLFHHPCYQAINSVGELAFADKSATTLL